MTVLSQPKEEPSSATALGKVREFIKDHPALLWAAVGLTGLGVVASFGGAAATPMLLGALPFLVRPFGTKTEPSVDLSRAEKAIMRNQSHLVWRLVDGEGETIGYAKYGSSNELERTKRFDQLMQQNNWQEQFNLLDIQYARVLAEDFTDLPSDMQRKIAMGKAAAAAFGRVRDFEDRSEQPFIVSALDIQGLTLGQWTLHPELMAVVLNNKPISMEEWKQVLDFIESLHRARFQHTDLLNNLYLSRTAENKLQLTLLDFEIVPDGREDSFVLAKWQQELEDTGLLIEETVSVDETTPDVSTDPKKSYDKLLGGLGLVVAGIALSQLVTPLAGASVLLGSFPFLIDSVSLKPEGETDLSPVTMASRRDGHLVWRLLNNKREALAYAKYGSFIELERTERFHRLAQTILENGKFDLINVQYPKVLQKGGRGLSWEILQQINREKEVAITTGEIREAQNRASESFLLSAIPLKGITLKQWKENPDLITYALKRQPISQAEWQQALAFFEALHDKGFQHTDLLHNLYLSRGDDRKLQIMLLDFEKVDGLASDDEILQEWEKRLRWQHLLREDGLDHKLWAWLGMATVGLILSRIVGPAAGASALLGTLPFLAHPTSLGKQNAELRSLANATQHERLRAKVGVIQDERGTPLAVWKIGTQEELDRTKRFGALVEKYKDKFSSIEIAYPHVLAEDLSVLPAAIREKIENDVKMTLGKKGNKIFILSYLGEERKGVFSKLLDYPGYFFKEIGEQPVSLAEWDDIVGFWNVLNTKEKFFHTDLSGNMDLAREAQLFGKNPLKMIVWDFENFHYSVDDSERLLLLWKELSLNNMIEQNPENPFAGTEYLTIQ